MLFCALTSMKNDSESHAYTAFVIPNISKGRLFCLLGEHSIAIPEGPQHMASLCS